MKNTWLNDDPFGETSSSSEMEIENDDSEVEENQNQSNAALQTELLNTIVIILGKLSERIVPHTCHPLDNHLSNQMPSLKRHATIIPKPQEWKTVTRKRASYPAKEPSAPDFQNINQFTVLENQETEGTYLPHLHLKSQDSEPAILQQSSVKQRTKPQIIINQKPESVTSWPKTIPGNATYADSLRNGQNIMVYSDSICNRMSKWEMNKKAKDSGIECSINKKAFPGATSQDLHSYHMLPTLMRNTPDEVIIHSGINETRQLADKDGGMTSEVIDLISNDIIKSGQVARSHGVNRICISAVLPVRGKKFQKTISLINYRVENLCKREGFDFISNVNIIFTEPTPVDDGLFYKDGLHLNAAGRQVLMDNFISYLNMH